MDTGGARNEKIKNGDKGSFIVGVQKPANCSGEWVITLEEAYKKKLLSKSDLREISEKFSGHESEDNPEEKLILEYGAERIEAVKKAEAGNINNYQSLKIKIIGYYGTYGGLERCCRWEFCRA